MASLAPHVGPCVRAWAEDTLCGKACESELLLMRLDRVCHAPRRRRPKAVKVPPFIITRAEHGDHHLSDTQKPKVIVIAGPTAVGKSTVAVELANRLDGEIVSADSVQVYKGLDVGSAKTTPDDRMGIPHHLIDIISPESEYGAGTFFDDARRATRKVLDAGRVPIVVGGTGMYLRWYITGKPSTPKSSHHLSTAVEKELAELQRTGNWDQAVQVLADAGDPASANRLTRNDWYRLHRTLEIVRATGRPRAPFALKGKRSPSDDAPIVNLDFDFRCHFLYKPRRELYRQIDARCEKMVADPLGLLYEASWMLDLGLRPNTNPATRAIGYRQAMEYLERCRDAGGRSSEKELYDFLTSFQKASRNFVRKQLTWFREDSLFRWRNAQMQVAELVDLMAEDYLGLPEPSVPSGDLEVLLRGCDEEHDHATYKPQLRIYRAADARDRTLDWISRTQDEEA